MESKFINVSYDKFENRKNSSMPYMRIYEGWITVNVSLMHISHPQSEELYLRIICLRREDWVYLKEGNLILNINDVENIVLKPYHVQMEPKHNIDYAENALYIIDQDLLRKICNAETLDMKISGREISDSFSATNFIKYAQFFYNGFYDENAYKEVLGEEILLWKEQDGIMTKHEILTVDGVQTRKVDEDPKTTRVGYAILIGFVILILFILIIAIMS